MREVFALPDGFKRRYMLSAFKEMMKGYREHFSYLGDKMPAIPSMAGMPGHDRMPESSK
jgi:hypothetical protein